MRRIFYLYQCWSTIIEVRFSLFLFFSLLSFYFWVLFFLVESVWNGRSGAENYRFESKVRSFFILGNDWVCLNCVKESLFWSIDVTWLWGFNFKNNFRWIWRIKQKMVWKLENFELWKEFDGFTLRNEFLKKN